MMWFKDIKWLQYLIASNWHGEYLNPSPIPSSILSLMSKFITTHLERNRPINFRSLSITKLKSSWTPGLRSTKTVWLTRYSCENDISLFSSPRHCTLATESNSQQVPHSWERLINNTWPHDPCRVIGTEDNQGEKTSLYCIQPEKLESLEVRNLRHLIRPDWWKNNTAEYNQCPKVWLRVDATEAVWYPCVIAIKGEIKELS